MVLVCLYRVAMAINYDDRNEAIQCYKAMSPQPPSPAPATPSPITLSPTQVPTTPELSRQDAFIVSPDDAIPYIVTDGEEDDDDFIKRPMKEMSIEDEAQHAPPQYELRKAYHRALQDLRVAEWNLESMAVLYDGEFVSLRALRLNKTGLDETIVAKGIDEYEEAGLACRKAYDAHYEHTQKHGVYFRTSIFEDPAPATASE